MGFTQFGTEGFIGTEAGLRQHLWGILSGWEEYLGRGAFFVGEVVTGGCVWDFGEAV